MKLTMIVVCALLCLVVSTGCHNEPSAKYERRYQAFVELLEGETLALFEAGRFDEAAARFTATLEADADLAARFDGIKEDENILFFSTVQVFRFFGETVRQQIAFHRAIEKGEPAPEGYVPDH